MQVDKNEAILTFIKSYEGISKASIFVNFINAKDNDIQYMTASNDVALNKKFIDGSTLKRYNFSLVFTKSIADIAVPQNISGSENIDDIADVQALMDWINEQGELHNFPSFGDECVIEEMHTTTENPSIDGISTEVAPPLAMYSIEIRIDYIDYSHIIWS